MSFCLKNGILLRRSPMQSFVRYRGKINIQRPREPHFERARFIAVTNPVIPPKSLEESCNSLENRWKKEKVENQYEKIIARDVTNWLNHSKTVAIFHVNSISEEQIFKLRVSFHKLNVHVKTYGKSIMRIATEGTRFEAILPLFQSRTYILFGPENSIAKIIKITKKVPQMILLAGIVEDRLLSKNELVKYSTMPGLDAMRAEFVSTLNYAASNINNNLVAHQKNLVNLLDAHSRNSTELAETTTEEQTEAPVKSDH